MLPGKVILRSTRKTRESGQEKPENSDDDGSGRITFKLVTFIPSGWQKKKKKKLRFNTETMFVKLSSRIAKLPTHRSLTKIDGNVASFLPKPGSETEPIRNGFACSFINIGHSTPKIVIYSKITRAFVFFSLFNVLHMTRCFFS